MSDQIKYTEVVFYYDLFYSDGRSELKSSVFTFNHAVSIEKFISNRIDALKDFNCYVFQVAIREVVTTKIIDFNKRGEQIEIL